MVRKQITFLLMLILLSCTSFAEGTKELKPLPTDKGNLLLLQGYSNFGLYGASAREQIKIRIASLSETIYVGLNNINGQDQNGSMNDNGIFVPNIPFRILSPSGIIVYSSVIPSAGQEGHIATWDEAVAGPQEMGNAGGYDAIMVKPDEEGDYIIEFDPAARNIVRLNIHLFDITVADAGNKPALGRLHSQGWQITTQSYNNPFNGKVYPYDGATALYQVDFNGMQPYVFVLNFNSTGTGNTGDFLEDRKSKIGNYTYGEFEVFLNPPDETLYPTVPKSISLDTEVERVDCMNSNYCLNFTTNSEGILDAFIDINQNGILDAITEPHFQQKFDNPGTHCIPWNGKDNFGNTVTGEFAVIASLGFGIMHLPLYDVEHNRNGYKISIARPAGATDPLIFWDDTEITDGTAIDGKLNLTGCMSSVAGCHKWINRGSLSNASALDKQETISTWWFSHMAYNTKIFYMPENHQVQLSFHPSSLVQNDTTVCKGEFLDFYIYNDGKNHFDLNKYTYDWYFNNQALSSDVRNQTQQITSVSQMVIKATERTASGCVSFDTLNINIVDPIVLQSKVIMPGCTSETGSIEVQMLSGPLNKEFFWLEFPEEKSGTLTGLPAGTYHVKAMDPDYPSCAADTTLTLTDVEGISIDTVITDGTLCYETSGKAQVFMHPPNKVYEYAWNGSSFGPNSSLESLAGGNYTVVVRDISTGCTDERPFIIPSYPFPVTVTSENELCGDASGSITLGLPSNDFTIIWNGASGNETNKTGLSAGSYPIRIISAENPSCYLDTVITIINVGKHLEIKDLILHPSECYSATGSAQVIMNPGDYQYSWNMGPFENSSYKNNLASGVYNVKIREANSTCEIDTEFVIAQNPIVFSVVSNNEICNSGNGSIKVQSSIPDAIINWSDNNSQTLIRSDLNDGSYHFVLSSAANPACKAESSVIVKDSSYFIPADFTYKDISGYDSIGKKLIQFTNLSSNYSYSSWALGDGETSNETNPLHTYLTDYKYEVTLTVTDSLGCYGVVKKSFSPFRIFDADCDPVTLPNAFSPNNDLTNDDIGILGYAPKVELKIFNRWGEVIFRTFEIENRWDGYYRGEEAPVGVYPYILDWECQKDDGTTIRKRKVGDITLIR